MCITLVLTERIVKFYGRLSTDVNNYLESLPHPVPLNIAPTGLMTLIIGSLQ
jgi:hypothetical protein